MCRAGIKSSFYYIHLTQAYLHPQARLPNFSQNLIHLLVCPGSRKISWGIGIPTVLSNAPFKYTDCRAQNEEKLSQQWWMKNFCPSLCKSKLEALVKLCHLSPALLLYGSIQACRLQMGFPWAFMQARLHCSNGCRKQTEEELASLGKGNTFSALPATLVHLM